MHIVANVRRLRRIAAIEFGMCRSSREGGSCGSVTVGNGKRQGQRGERDPEGGIVSVPVENQARPYW
jgi:hypothetical protein